MAFDYAKAYQQFIDEEFAAASATAWMIPEAGKVRFTGGRDIEISTLSTTGLGNYDAGKADGSAYPQGTVTNSWKSYTLSMDRGVKFSLDRTDPNDTGFLVTAENVIREFARNALVKGAGHLPHPPPVRAGQRRRGPQYHPHRLRRSDQDQRHRHRQRPVADRP